MIINVYFLWQHAGGTEPYDSTIESRLEEYDGNRYICGNWLIDMEKGIKGEGEIIVTEGNTAQALGSGSLAVLATPAMVALMEKTARLSVAPYLEEGQSTVGTLVNVKHLAASPVGMRITCKTELVDIDRRRLVFHVECSDEAGLIGEGEHERFIIDEAKFMAKAEAKLNK